MYKSQWGQDRWLNENIFHNKKNGIFVDVGAHDGVNINNTFFFEKNCNWTGICIEPIPIIFEKLIQNRNCCCIQGCAYNQTGVVNFDYLTGWTEMLSGVSEDYNQKHLQRISNEMKQYGGKRKKLKVQSFTLEKIFRETKINYVDYLSIDTEGSELKVLQGINFDKVFIDIIQVEANYLEDSVKVKNFLIHNNFSFIKKCKGDNIFRNNKKIKI